MTKLGGRIVDFERENADLRRRLDEALAQHAATTEVLQVINASPGELAPVFDAILERAMRLCEAAFGILLRYDGEHFHAAAHHGLPAEFARFINDRGMDGWRGAHLSLIDGAPFVHILDLAEDRATYEKVETRRALIDLGGARSLVLVPLQLDGELLGSLAIYRQEVRPFSNRQIALLGEFADQAVIAMENARLGAETRESLERQTATSEILGVIAAAPGDAEGTLKKIAETTNRLFGAASTSFRIAEGDEITLAIGVGRGAEAVSAAIFDPARPRIKVGAATLPGTVIRENRQFHLPDLDNLPPEFAHWPGPPVLRAAGTRTLAATPLRREGRAIGAFIVHRDELRPFTPDELRLLQSFADQAAIAIENARLINETREALDQQTATAEVLGVINASPGDLAPVFDAMLEKAMRLCGAAHGALYGFDGEFGEPLAARGEKSYVDFIHKRGRVRFLPGTPLGDAMAGEPIVHIPDVRETQAYRRDTATRFQALVNVAAMRTNLNVPLRKDEAVLGAIALYRQEVRPFTDKQIALLRNFAAQAVIAMENARLITETREALEQQTATAEVLQVINSSPGELVPVFDAMLEKAMRLCEAELSHFMEFDGERFRTITLRGASPDYAEFMSRPLGPGETGGSLAALVRGDALAHVPDLKDSEAYRKGNRARRALVDLGRARTGLWVGLRNESGLRGALVLYRTEVRPFTDKHIALLQNFAAQAVIAIENARLITETQEALDQQTATAEVLGVINASPGDLAPVFDAILEKAHTLCDSGHGTLFLRDGDTFRPAAMRGVPEPIAARLRPGLSGADNPVSNPLLVGERFVHIEDTAQYDHPLMRAANQNGVRTLLSVPLKKGSEVLGMIVAARFEAPPFTDKQIALLQNFAAQAVIAMENARLLTETREALEQQTATAEVLGVINSSPGDLAPVFDAILEKAHSVCGANYGSLQVYDGDTFRAMAIRGLPEKVAKRLKAGVRPGHDHPLGGVLQGDPFVQVPDMAALDVTIARMRTVLCVPLRKDGKLLGQITASRPEVRLFSDKQIALLQNFAAQAVIAMENARLITETREAREEAETALHDLQAAQTSLVQAQKMAALGQLTAGIAHEIKNPLNFVNNFASLSTELLGELKEEVTPVLAAFDEHKRGEIDETIDLLTGNLDKIVEHGQRADNIVKSMLEHSRGVSGERRDVDLNALIEDALNLAYHGARAQDASFNVALERDYAQGLKSIELAPQEMTRVFLNLFGNGFYATNKRARENRGASFRPFLLVATRDLGSEVEIAVRDNGTGISPEIRDNLFQPFFTTKPTGEGTGLGLSISYDIVTQQHGGTITVESEPGSFTVFTIRLPRR